MIIVKIYGYKKNELIGEPFTLVLPENHQKTAQKLHDEFIDGKPEIPMEWKVQRKNGELLDVVVTAGLLIDDEGNRYKVTTVTDITKQKKNQELVNRFGRILARSYNEIYIFDAKKLNIIQANQGALQNIGYSTDELKDKTILDFVSLNSDFDFDSLSAPLMSKEKGIISFETIFRRKDGTFYEVEVRLQFMHHEDPPVFVAIVQDISEKKKLIKVQEELRLASEIQAKLMPNEFPQVEGYDFAGKNIPSKEVGGDYFDFIQIDDSKIAVCLGDVSGKGMPASLLMANLQAAVRGQTFLKASPNECQTSANSLIYQNTDMERYVTFFYGILDTKNQSLTFSNAGHEFPLVLSKDGKKETLETGGLILGYLPNYIFEEETIHLKPFDIFVTFSDGIIEAQNENEEQFGAENMISVIKTNQFLSAKEIIDKVFEAVYEFCADHELIDDLSLIVIKKE
jgi:PAS domain S-box-containing protein